MTIFDLGFYLLLNYLTILILYLSGHTIHSVFKPFDNRNYTFYVKMLTGLIVIVSLFAIIHSGFHSYLITSLPLTLFLIYLIRERISLAEFVNNLKVIEKRPLYFYFIITTIVYFLTIISLVNYKGELYYIAYDYSFYAGISEILLKTGIETFNWDLALNGIRVFQFYHYFELWFGAIFIGIFNINSLQAIILLVFVTINSLAIFGVNLLLNKKNELNKNYFYFSFLILIISPLYRTLRWILGIEGGEMLFNQSIISDLSIKTPLVLLLSILLIYNRKSDHKILTFILLLTCMIYPTTMIMIIPSLFIWLIYKKVWYRNKIASEILALTLFVITFSGVVFLSLYDANLTESQLTGNIVQATSRVGVIQVAIAHFRENPFKVTLEPVIFFVYQIVSYLPFLLLLAAIIINQKLNNKKYFKEHQSLISFLIIAFIVGSFGRSLLSFTENGRQITNNFFHPLFILSATLIVIKSIINQPSKKIFLSGVAVLILILGLNIPRTIITFKSPIPTGDYEFLAQKFRDSDDEIAFISTKNVNSTYVYYPYAHLRWFIRDYFPSSLSPLHLMDNFDPNVWERQSVPRSSKYYNDIVVQEKSIPDVINENKIRYLLIENKHIESVNLGTDLIYSSKQLRDFLFFEFTHN